MSTYSIVGAYFRPPAAAVLQVLPSGCQLFLTPEPENPYDPNAVRVTVMATSIPESEHDTLTTLVEGHGMDLQEVLNLGEIHLGYVPRTEAETLQPTLNGRTPAELGFNAKGKPTVVLS